MGFAKVLLGRGSKETGLSKCARIDSLGLARRRLAGKAAQEVLDTGAADFEATGQDGDVAPTAQGLLDLQTESDAILLRFTNRHHRDSLRIYRQRFRERSSLDLPNGRSKSALPETGVSFSSHASPSSPTTREGQDVDKIGDADDGSGDDQEPLSGRTSCPGNTARRHVRFRRASDGEYLTTTRGHKAHESGFPSALKAVQQKAERLFRRITANFTESHISRASRSETPSRGGSPVRPSRSAATSRAASATWVSTSWALGLRKRSVDLGSSVGGGGGDVAPAAAAATDADGADGAGRQAAAAAAAAGRQQRRGKRQSAPGELYFSSIIPDGGVVVQDPAVSPRLSSAVGRPRARSVTTKNLVVSRAVSVCATAGPGSGASPGFGSAGAGAGTGTGTVSGVKSRNWLARISRSLVASSSPSSPHKAPAEVAAAVATQPSSPPYNDGGMGLEGLAGQTNDAAAAAAKERQLAAAKAAGSSDDVVQLSPLSPPLSPLPTVTVETSCATATE
ncbi:hypothetical protein VOLCADRAFT_92136 [Volvox carteri f. nagariensis]|uniref:Uncharacterized protein n=1 Tax=Volvox carteri f. nagariensis TaxID=3068 RepID=D8TYP8_VOLCA|nr:uncharacterized protein VOLCADRAFT_92136 [Volvox carteri f. nagariensis]EFJ47431.1 hypothetical protein VOLCADRAFT_92136 [Volvox carteri f. nagariensis]|eukprot:XP_002951620.1 hypothetical protein VOLCADRAFT_92136 [Volvox carteri f. nagariensis]